MPRCLPIIATIIVTIMPRRRHKNLLPSVCPHELGHELWLPQTLCPVIKKKSSCEVFFDIGFKI